MTQCYGVMHAVLVPGSMSGPAFSLSAGIVKTRAMGVVGWFSGNRAWAMAREASKTVDEALLRRMADWRNDIPPGNEIIFDLIDAVSKAVGKDTAKGGLGVFLHDSTEGRLYYSILGNIGLALLQGGVFSAVSGGRPKETDSGLFEPGRSIQVSMAGVRPGASVLCFTPGMWDMLPFNASESALADWLGKCRFEAGRLLAPSLGAKNRPDPPGVLIFMEESDKGPCSGLGRESPALPGQGQIDVETGPSLADLGETVDDIFSAVCLSLAVSGKNTDLEAALNGIKARMVFLESVLVHHDDATGEKKSLACLSRNIHSKISAMEDSIGEIRESLGIAEKSSETAAVLANYKPGRQGLSGKSSLFGMISSFASSIAELKSYLESKDQDDGTVTRSIEYRDSAADQRIGRILEILEKLEANAAPEIPGPIAGPEEKACLTAGQWLDLAVTYAEKKYGTQADIRDELKALFDQLTANADEISKDRTIDLYMGGSFFRVKSGPIKKRINIDRLLEGNLPEYAEFVELYFTIIGNSIYEPDFLRNGFLKLDKYYGDKAILQKFLFFICIYVVAVLSIINYAFIFDFTTYVEPGNSSYESAIINAKRAASLNDDSKSAIRRPTGETGPPGAQRHGPAANLSALLRIMSISAEDYSLDIECLRKEIIEAGKYAETLNFQVEINNSGCLYRHGPVSIKWKSWMADRPVSGARLGQLWLQLAVSPPDSLPDGFIGPGTRSAFTDKYGSAAGPVLDRVMAWDWKA